MYSACVMMSFKASAFFGESLSRPYKRIHEILRQCLFSSDLLNADDLPPKKREGVHFGSGCVQQEIIRPVSTPHKEVLFAGA